MEAYTKLVCLTLKRDTFTEILGPLEQLMTREKSPTVGAACGHEGVWGEAVVGNWKG